MTYLELLDANRDKIEEAIIEAEAFSCQHGYPCSVYLWSNGKVEIMEGTFTQVPKPWNPDEVWTIYVANNEQECIGEDETEEEWLEDFSEWFRKIKMRDVWEEIYQDALEEEPS